MEVTMDVLGIDLAKLRFDATLRTASGTQQYASFANTAEGFTQLHAWLGGHGVSDLHACMEATNIYWEALATWLHAHNYAVSVVNPARIKGYAQATMQRNTTDKLDSAVIAAFCAKHRPAAWEPHSAEQRHLRALVRHRDDLRQTQLQQQNRLRDATNALVTRSLRTILAALADEIATIERQLKEHVAAQSRMQTNLALLTSIVGIGVVTATKLLAEFPGLEQYTSAKAAAADAGLTPSQYESGTSVRRRPKLSKQGKAPIRAALYWPAITAMTRCPAIKAFADRLTARGKPKKVVICAVMRKLVHICYGVLTHQTPYDPTKAVRRTALST
jgi:transposase